MLNITHHHVETAAAACHWPPAATEAARIMAGAVTASVDVNLRPGARDVPQLGEARPGIQFSVEADGTWSLTRTSAADGRSDGCCDQQAVMMLAMSFGISLGMFGR